MKRFVVGAVLLLLGGCVLIAPPSTAVPRRAAFYYPWFPETWGNVAGGTPFTNYNPSRGFYSSDDVSVVRAQVADMQRAGITLGIASWFGRGSSTDQHWPAMMSGAAGTGFGWVPYYEPEGIGDPTPAVIAEDLHYLNSRYGSGPLTLISGKGMVVFVYNADDPTQAKGCDTVARWAAARMLLKEQYGETVYVNLKVFPGYAACPVPPSGSVNAWHQYGPASSDADFSQPGGGADGSYTISPGYWKSGFPAAAGSEPFLVRDRTRWQAAIRRMVASPAAWELITTFNEWGEGTAVEGSAGCRVAVSAGTLCAWGDQLLDDLVAVPPA